MTDRFHSLTVVLDADMRDDDAQQLIAAIRQLRHVTDVAGNVVDVSDWIAQARAKDELRMKLFEALK